MAKNEERYDGLCGNMYDLFASKKRASKALKYVTVC